MCNIAGYTGSRRAAPILIEMMRREQFIDGGLSTGIATIHEGKLYTAKVLGDVDDLLRMTDALNFPGSVGIMHTRPNGNLASHAHPFTSSDGEVAIVLNGTSRDVTSPAFYAKVNGIMENYLSRGFDVKTLCEPKHPEKCERLLSNGCTYHASEPYALMIGESVAGTAPEMLSEAMADAMRNALSELPADIVVLALNARLDGMITVGDITRPMVAGFGDGETFLATTALAFPEEIQTRPMLPIPPTSVSQVTPSGIKVTNCKLKNVRVEQITPGMFAKIYSRMEKALRGKENEPLSLYDLPLYTDWKDIWSKPYVDCKYVADGERLLKPYATLLYEVLWSFYKEGRLHSTLGEYKGRRIMRYWIDG